tara:strand:+ start:37 stop:1407 length:1371 start_codon:yes stop_codon:yes gene_type:complete
MDDYNLNVLSEAKNEYSSRLLNILTPLIIQGVKSIFNEAVDLCKNNDEDEKYLMTFQNFLSRVPNWNTNIINEEKNRIVTKSKCSYLEDLLTCVHITQVKILTSIRVSSQQKKIDIDIPKLGNFIHSAYINFARKLYKNIYLFEKDVMPLDYQKNMRECEILCRESIFEVIRESMPIEHILRAYMDKTTHEEIIEETLEKQVTEGEAVDMLEEAKKNMEDKETSSDVTIDKIDSTNNDNEIIVEEPNLVTNDDAAKTAVAKPIDVKPVDAKLVDAKLVDAKLVDTKLVDTKPMESSELEKTNEAKKTMELQNDVSVAKEAIKELKKAVDAQNLNEGFKSDMENVKNDVTQEVSSEISKKKTLISFNDKDSVLDMGTNNEMFVNAPKTPERLEKISKEANDRRKAEEEEEDFYDDDDEGPLNIIGDNISLDINDIDDLNPKSKSPPEITLDDIEVLA